MAYEILEDIEVPSTGLSNQKPLLGNSPVRHAARTGARIAETALGLPGDVAHTISSLAESQAKNLENIPDIFTQGPFFGLAKSIGPALGKLKDYIPTTETIKKYGTEKIAELLPAGFLEAQNDYEKASDEFFKDVVGFIHPAFGPLKTGLKTAAALSGVGNLASFGAKKLGFGEGTQDAVKLGSILGTSLLSAPYMTQKAANLERTAEKHIPKGELWSGSKVVHGLKEGKEKLSHIKPQSYGIAEQRASNILEGVQEILKENNGKIPLESVDAYDKLINRNLYELSKQDKKAVTEYLFPLKRSLKETISSSAKKFPQWADSLLAADELWSGLYKGASIESFMNNVVQKANISDPTAQAILGTSYAATGSLKPGAALNTLRGLKNGINKATEVIKKSPAVRKYYTETITAALKNNTNAAIRNARLLEKAVQEAENKTGVYEILE